MTRKYRCPGCSAKVELEPVVLAHKAPVVPDGEAPSGEDAKPIAINWPVPFCAVCDGEPEMERVS